MDVFKYSPTSYNLMLFVSDAYFPTSSFALIRGIKWSLRVFASMQAVRLFLRARAAINFLLRAESTLEITNGEQRTH